MSDVSLLLSSSFAITIQGGRGKERHLAVVEGYCLCSKTPRWTLLVFIYLSDCYALPTFTLCIRVLDGLHFVVFLEGVCL